MANFTHPPIVKKLWRHGVRITQEVFADVLEKDQGNQESNIERYISQARMRLQGIAGVLHDKMSQDPTPNRIVSEITITNPVTRHEGRIDAIFDRVRCYFALLQVVVVGVWRD